MSDAQLSPVDTCQSRHDEEQESRQGRVAGRSREEGRAGDGRAFTWYMLKRD